MKDSLFVLIKSLSKSEKRQFKVFVNRLGANADAKFIALFNLLDKMKTYDEEQILASNIVTKQQLSNLKAHLSHQILVSLRLSPQNQNVRTQIREQMDFATILYEKGLYRQSLKVLDKAKTSAIENEEKNMAFEIIEFEKVIESQFITRSIASRADELSIQARDISRLNVLTSKLSNLSLQMYGLVLKMGYARSEEDIERINEYFFARLPEYNLEDLGFREKLWIYKAHLWHSFLVQDFLSGYRHSSKLVNLFYDKPNMIILNPVWFMKGSNYLLECLYLTKYLSLFRRELTRLEDTMESSEFPDNENVQAQKVIYLYYNKFNLHFMEGSFREGEYLVEEVLGQIRIHEDRIDEHHVMILYYKIACLYFGMGDNKTCIAYLNKIIDNKQLALREDLMCFSRVLSLVAHYEAGLDYNLENQIRETYKFLIKMNDLHEVQREMIKFLRNLLNIHPHELKDAFVDLHKRLKSFEDHPFEKRSFLYLDIISWLESKIENRSVGDVVKEKGKLMK